MAFFFNDTATTEIYTLSLHDALPICVIDHLWPKQLALQAPQQSFLQNVAADIEIVSAGATVEVIRRDILERSEEHTAELQSPDHLVCRLLLEQKNTVRRSSYLLAHSP